MLVKIPQVLNPDQLQDLSSTLETAEFVDGKVTAGWHAKTVKQNEQLTASAAKDIREIIQTALRKNALFQVVARPRVIHTLLFSRYTVGMSYGRHVDNALMGKHQYRSDLSFTVFLNSPDQYQGGELVVETVDDEQAYKLEAGSALVYPSSSLHRVDPVTEGIRLVAVGWVQSIVRDPHEREILFELDTARRSLFAKHGKTDEFDILSKTLSNLLRKWSE